MTVVFCFDVAYTVDAVGGIIVIVEEETTTSSALKFVDHLTTIV